MYFRHQRRPRSVQDHQRSSSAVFQVLITNVQEKHLGHPGRLNNVKVIQGHQVQFFLKSVIFYAI